MLGEVPTYSLSEGLVTKYEYDIFDEEGLYCIRDQREEVEEEDLGFGVIR